MSMFYNFIPALYNSAFKANTGLQHILSHQTLARIFSLIYLGILCVALLAPVPDFVDGSPQGLILSSLLDLDFYTHLFAFLVWGILASSWQPERISLLAGVVIACLLEFTQPLTSVRVFEITDLAANIAGTVIGFYIGATSVFPRN